MKETVKNIQYLVSTMFLILLSITGFSQTYNFTTAGAVGRFGPTQTQINSSYSATNLSGTVTSSSGVQLWTVPATGTYKIEAAGAQGGIAISGILPTGGLGARMAGQYNLVAGQILKIVVGQQGQASSDAEGAGGGGGSFVVNNTTPLIVAGGGGGGGRVESNSALKNATTANIGNNGNYGGLAGTVGNGGSNANTNSTAAGGGAGINSNGGNSGTGRPNAFGGIAFFNGASGGANENATTGGGFGGGGGGGNNCGYGGGGGGYSGGGAGGYNGGCGGVGGGAGSYNAGTNQTNTAAAISGNGYVTITVLITPATGLNFDGVNDYVDCGNAAAIRGLSSTGFTLEAFINPSSVTGVAKSIIRKTGDYNLYVYSGRLYLEVWSIGNGAGTFRAFAGSTPVNAGTWTHVAATWNGNTTILYVNGAADPSSLVNSGTINQSENLWLGRSSIYDNPYTGSIDEVRIWNRVLCQGEIMNNKSCEVAATSLGLAAYYKLNQGSVNFNNSSVTTMIDASSNGNNGTLVNFALSGTTSNWAAGTISGTCTAFSAPTFTITPSGPTAFCEGGSVTLTASLGANYLWSNGATTQVVSATTAGSYSVTGTNVQGCSSTSAVTTVTVNALPTATIAAGGSIAFCEGGSVTLTASNGASYLWSNGATTQSIAATTAGNYSVTVTNAQGCSSTSAATAVTVNALPTATITASGPTTFCAGSSVILSTDAATGNAINFTGGNYVQSTNPALPLGNAARTMEAWIKTTTGNGGAIVNWGTTVSNQRSGMLMINGRLYFVGENNDLIGATPINDGNWHHVAVTFTGATLSMYVDGVLDAASNKSLNTSGTVLRIGQRSVGDSYSELFIGTIDEVRIWNFAKTQAQIQASKNQVISLGTTGLVAYYKLDEGAGSSTADATGLGSVGNLVNGSSWVGPSTAPINYSNYLWSPEGQTTSSITVNATGNYFVTATNAQGCSAISPATAVTVNPLPTAVITASGPTTICTGSSVTLTASEGSSYLWSNGATTQSINVLSTGSYSVTVTANGCSTTSAATDVTVNTAPAIFNCPATGYQQIYASANSCSQVFSYSPSITGTAPVVTYEFTGATIASGTGTGSGSSFNVGQTTVTISVSNDCGSSNCSFVVTVVDNVAPTALTKNVTVYLNAAGQASITPQDINNGSFDNCGPVSFAFNAGKVCGFATENQYATLTAPSGTVISNIDFASYGTPNGSCGSFTTGFCHAGNSIAVVSPYLIGRNSGSVPASNGLFGDPCGGTVKRLYIQASYGGGNPLTTTFDCSKLGNNNVVLLVTDANGNVSSANATVTVLDTITPTISGPSNISAIATSAAGAVVNYATPVGVDNCTPTNVRTAGLASGATFPIGTTTVTHKVSDASGLFAQHSFTVTVVGVAPQVVCPSNITVNNAAGQCGANVSFSATETTAIPASTITYSIASGSYFAVGTTQVTVTATNAIGSSSCTFNVKVVDNEAPGGGASISYAAPAMALANVPEAAGYNLVYALDVPNFANWDVNTQVPYSVNNSAALASKPFSRVAYLMDLGTKWVWVSFDKVTSSLSEIGVPVDYIKKQSVSNMNVYSSAGSGVTNGTNIATGSIEFWSNCYGVAASNPSIPVGNNNLYDFNDDNNYQTDCYGSFQVHNYAIGQTIFAYNCWSESSNGDLGIGNQVGGSGHPDWTFAHNTAAYGTKKIYVFVSGSSVAVNNPTINLDANGQATLAIGQVDPGITDNCGIASKTLSKTSFNCSNLGINTVTLTVTDIHGNVSTGTSTVTVVDNIAPTISCPVNINVYATSAAGAAVTYVTPVGADNCTATTIRTSGLASGSTFPIGTTTVTHKVTDAAGNTAQCSFTVTVTGLPPVVVCPSNISVYTAEQCGNNVGFAATETTAIPASTITYSRTPGSFFPVGTTTVTATATNAVGISTCTFTVTVIDNEFPTVNVPSAISVNTNAGICGATVTYTTPVGTDNCSVTTEQTFGLPSGAVFPVGTTVNKFKATDASGNVTYNSFTVTVTDNELPVLHVPSAISVNTDAGICGATVTYATPVGTDNCSVTTEQTFGLPSGAVFPVGTTVNKFKAADASGNVTENSFTVTVTDNELPVLVAVPANTTVECDAVPAAATVTATDNCTTSVPSFTETRTNGNCPSNYTLTRTWSTTDASGNTTTASQTIIVQDTKAPVLSAAPVDATTSCSAVPAAAILTATDNCDASPVVTYNQASTQSSNVNNVAHYNYTLTRTWTATDACGNSSSRMQTITVKDSTAPVASCKPVTITLVGGVASITASSVDNNSADNCSPVTLSVSKTLFTCANLGSNTVTLTVKDVNGNTSTCYAIVTVLGEIPTCSIASVPTSNVFTGGVSTNLYFGYGAQSTTLQVNAPASGAPYTYSWTGAGLSSTTSGAPIFTPTATGSYAFTVKTTNKYGCFTTCSITICVRDVRVPGTDGKKVYVCHLPPGNPGNAQTLSISVNAVPSHIGLHGDDRLGTCDMQPCGTAARAAEPAITSIEKPKMEVIVAPNPSTTYFELVVKTKAKEMLNIRIMDANGRLVEQRKAVEPNSYIIVGSSYTAGMYYAEIVQGTERKVVKLIKGK
jgi:hypothetical protein